jgi:DNA-directed RNA polymerase specialized sigma24 family protein
MDSKFVAQAQAGDQDAFAQLATASAGRLHSVAYNILRDREVAQDATQQALLSITPAATAPTTAQASPAPSGSVCRRNSGGSSTYAKRTSKLRSSG